jgi:hypothetical protein
MRVAERGRMTPEALAPHSTAHVSYSVRPDHHIVGNVEPIKVIERAVLVDEDFAPDIGVDATGRKERRNQ